MPMNKSTIPADTKSSFQPSGGPIPSSLDLKKVTSHLKEHVTYPATRTELVAACNGLADFKSEEKEWFSAALPDRRYFSADEVLAAVGQKN